MSAQDFALCYLQSPSLAHKCAPGKIPSRLAPRPEPLDLRPARPPELRVTTRRPRSFKQGALERPEVRARLHHTFWHHELQAAELFCWALLRFVDTPPAFQRGLLRIFRDEVRHMGLYHEHLQSLGFGLSDFEVRDWFWERVPTCQTPLQFVALVGMGLEAANLDHTERFARWFRAVGDHRAAAIQDQVGREEIAHVRFATHWFRKWTGGVEFDQWRGSLPPPLSPLMMKGRSIHTDRRLRADFPPAFIEQLAAFVAADVSAPVSGAEEP